MALAPIIPAFIWGEGGARMTPEEVARQRKVLDALAGRSDTSPVGHWTQGLARMTDALGDVLKERRVSAADAQNQTEDRGLRERLLQGLTGGAGGQFPAAPGAHGLSHGDNRVMAAHGAAGDMGAYRDAIASIESRGSGDYAAVGPTHPRLGRALGRYQIMEANIGPWSREVLGREVTPDEFVANPALQDAIFDGKFGQYVQQFGPEGAAQAWFAGPGGVGKMDRRDSLGTSVAAYSDKFRNALGAPATPEMALEGMAETLPSPAFSPETVQAAAAGSQAMPRDTGLPAGVDPQSLVENLPMQGQTAPALGAPREVPEMQVAQALTGQQMAPIEAAGGAGNMQAPGGGGINPLVLEALSSDFASDQTRQIAGLLLNQHMEQQAAQQAQQQRMQAAQAAGIDPRFLGDDTILSQAASRQFSTTSDIQNYDAYAADERAAGRQPLSRLEFEQALRSSGATSITNVLGGEQLTPGQKKIDEAFADTYLSWNSGGFADSMKQVEQLGEAIQILESGENVTGTIGLLPDQLRPFFNEQGAIARENVEEVVQRSLREILGAQFTEKEGERLIARAFNPLLPPQENAKRVRRLLNTIVSMGDAKQDMVNYFDEHGTLRGYRGSRPTLAEINRLSSDFGAAPDEDEDKGNRTSSGVQWSIEE